MEEQLIAVGERYVDYYRLLGRFHETLAEGESKCPGIVCGEMREDEFSFLRLDSFEL